MCVIASVHQYVLYIHVHIGMITYVFLGDHIQLCYEVVFMTVNGNVYVYVPYILYLTVWLNVSVYSCLFILLDLRVCVYDSVHVQFRP